MVGGCRETPLQGPSIHLPAARNVIRGWQLPAESPPWKWPNGMPLSGANAWMMQEYEGLTSFPQLGQLQSSTGSAYVLVASRLELAEQLPPSPSQARLPVSSRSTPIELLLRTLHFRICFQGIQSKTAVFVKIPSWVIWLKLAANTM